MGFVGVFPTLILAVFTCFILFYKSRNFEQQELLANFYRNQVFKKLDYEPKVFDSGWSGCHLDFFPHYLFCKASLLRFNKDIILVRSLFGLIISTHCWITKNSPLVVENGPRYRRSDIGDGELITSLSSDHLRQTLYALGIPNLFKTSTKSIKQIRPLYILLPIIITSYGLWLFLMKTDFHTHKYQTVSIDINSLLLLTNENLFIRNQNVDELIYLPERKVYKIHYDDETRSVTVIQNNDLTYAELENVVHDSHKFANHPLQK